MDKVEKRGVNVQQIVLATIKVAGLLAVAVLAPNCVQLIRYLPGHKKYYRKKYLEQTAEKLNRRGLIRWVNKDGKKFAALTPEGERMLARHQLSDLKKQNSKKWDGRWRLIIFDIKEFKRKIRDSLRTELSNFGLVRLQNSVWVFPHECEEFVFLLKTAFGLGREVLHITAHRIENDQKLRQHFGFGS